MLTRRVRGRRVDGGADEFPEGIVFCERAPGHVGVDGRVRSGVRRSGLEEGFESIAPHADTPSDADGRQAAGADVTPDGHGIDAQKAGGLGDGEEFHRSGHSDIHEYTRSHM